MGEFEKNIISIYQGKGEAWLKGLPRQVRELAALWNLSGLIPVKNLSYNYVLSGFQKDQPVILKLGLDIAALTREALALKAFSQHGAVTLIDQSKGVLLLQRAIPGISLKDYQAADAREKLSISCEVIQKLHCAPVFKDQLPHVRDWFTILDQDWDLPRHYLKKVQILKKKLLLNEHKEVLLHGDLHYDNIILAGDDWKVIDPKSVIGYVINEVWAVISDIETDIGYVAEQFNVTRQCVLEWYFVHLILAACWRLQDCLEPQPFLSLAEKVYPML